MTTAEMFELLIASWIVSGDGDGGFPLGDDRFAGALKAAVEEGAFPPEFRDLGFRMTPAGVRSNKVPEMIEYGFTALFLNAPNPMYSTATVTLSHDAAVAILDEHHIGLSDAIEWGRTLRTAIANAKSAKDI